MFANRSIPATRENHPLPAALAAKTTPITAVDYRWIEELILQHWHPLHTQTKEGSGWIMRFSNGYTQRANSIHPIVPYTAWSNATPTVAQVIEQIEQCEQIYHSRALPAVFRISPFIQTYALDRFLAERGYTLNNYNSVHWLDLNAAQSASNATLIRAFQPVADQMHTSPIPPGEHTEPTPPAERTGPASVLGYGEYSYDHQPYSSTNPYSDSSISSHTYSVSSSNDEEMSAHSISFTIEDEAAETWLSAYQKLNQIPAQHHETMQLMLQQTPANKAFISWKLNNQIIACGLGIVSDRTIGLYDIVTDEAFRGRGIAEQMIKELLHWAIRNGAKSSYLMVLDQNQPALRLYSKLGFRKLYSAWFRVL